MASPQWKGWNQMTLSRVVFQEGEWRGHGSLEQRETTPVAAFDLPPVERLLCCVYPL